MRNVAVLDAQQRALAFLIQQNQRIEREVYQMRYADIQYPTLIPIDTNGPEWVNGVTYFTGDMVGRARWFHGKADDINLAEVTREKFETTISTAAMGYEYDLEELGRAMQLNIDLRADKANAARRAVEEFIDKVAITGDTDKNYLGLTNQTSVTAGSAAATGTGSTTTWSTKTPDNILKDVNDALTGMWTGTIGAEMADTLLLPITQYNYIGTTRIDATNQTTILQWILQNNVYTLTTGQQLTVRGVWGLETAGSGSTPRMVAYRRSPEVLIMYMPMPFQFLEPMRVGPIRYVVPGIFRISGVDVRRPKGMRYVDGI